jgi:tetratricopeptide (TPR) repeat protein
MGQRRSDREAAADAYNAANRLLERADNAGAVRKYGIALELDAGLAAAYYNRALALSRMGNAAAAAADLQAAAMAGLDEDYFYDAWVRHQVLLGGFVSVLRLCESWDIPTHQRHRLEERLNFHLRQRHFLLNEAPEAGMKFAAESLVLRCYMADLLRNVSPDVEVIDHILGLLAENVGDAEAEWRARYLVAAVYGSEILQPMETIEGSVGLFWDDAQMSTMFVVSEGARSALDAVLGNCDEGWAALSRETRFARFALSQLDIATKTLVADRQFRIGLVGESFTHWGVVEDVFRASVELSLHLCDGRAYQWAVGRARHFSAIVAASGWVTSTDGAEWSLPVVKRRLDRLLGVTDLEPLPSLPPSTLVIDYFIYEKASDTIACHVAAQSGSGFDTRPISPDMVMQLLGISQQWDRPDTAALDARREDVSPEEIRRVVFRSLLAEHDVPSDAYPAAVDEAILGCLRSRLRHVERLVIVPWGLSSDDSHPPSGHCTCGPRLRPLA